MIKKYIDDTKSLKIQTDTEVADALLNSDQFNSYDIHNLIMTESPLGMLYYNCELNVIQFFNKMFLDIWRFNDLADCQHNSVLSIEDLTNRIEPLINKPGRFLELFTAKIEETRKEDVFRLTDGRLIWQYSTPIKINDKVAGRLLFYNDITSMDMINASLQENLHWQEIVTTVAGLLNGTLFNDNERHQGILSIIGNHFSFDRTAILTASDFKNGKISYIWSSDKAPAVIPLAEYESSLSEFTEHIINNRMILEYTKSQDMNYPVHIIKAMNTFIKMGYKSCIFIPLYNALDFVGIFFAGTFDNEIKWDDKIIERLSFVTGMISGVIVKNLQNSELKKSQELFSIAFDENPSALLIYRISDNKILDVNKSFLSLYGFDRDEILSHSIIEFGLLDKNLNLNKLVKSQDNNLYHSEKIKVHTKSFETKIVTVTARKIEISGEECILTTIIDETYNEKLQNQLRLMEASISKFNIPVFWVRSDGAIIYSNDAACKHLGYNSREIINLHIWQIDATVNEEYWLNNTWPMMNENREYFGETRLRRKNGTVIPVQMHVSCIEFDNEQYLFTIVEDISERIRIDNALHTTTRSWHAISECNQAVVRGTDEVELIKDICRILVDVGGYKFAWVGYKDIESDGKDVIPISIYGDDQDFFNNVTISWDDDISNSGATGTAIRTMQPVIIRNVFTDPAQIAYREELIRRGFVSTAAFPIIIDGVCIGALNIAGTKVNTFDKNEVELLIELTNDLSYGISTIRVRKERINAMQELQKERDQAQQYLDIAGVMILALDIQGNILMLNKKGYEILEYNNDELTGKNWFETCIPESTYSEIREIFFNVMLSEKTFDDVQQHENAVITASGNERIISFKNNYIKDENGRVIGLLSSGEDVTDIRRAEEKHQLMLKTAPDGFSVVNYPGGQIIEVNDAYALMLGYSENELLKMNIKDIEAHFDKSSLKMLLKHIVDSGSDRFISKLRKKDGSVLDVEVSVNYDNVNHCFLIFSRDISDRIKSESQMLQAAKMESVGRLAGGVAHDFNNIMTGILGQASLTIGEVKTDKTKNRMKEIIELSERASNLTRQLLTFSRKQTIEMVPVDVNSLIKDALKMLSRLVREDISIHFEPSKQACVILADVGQMEQILMNLAVNAKDAMTNGGDIYISTDNVEIDKDFVNKNPGSSEGEYVCITVRDTGEGMDKVTLENIFIPFFTTKDTGQGTGLGLATVYGIVKKHNGYIKVESIINGGSTFKVYIPGQSDFSREITKSSSAVPVQIFKGQGRETILVVEDEISVRKTVTAVLNHAGYVVLAAATPSEARIIFNTESDKIDMMLTDIIMPEENGVELYRSFSTIKPDMPVVFMSGYSDGLLHSDLQPGETFQMLSKPFRPHDLLNRVRAVLDNRNG